MQSRSIRNLIIFSNRLIPIFFLSMGSTVQSCCGEASRGGKLEKKKTMNGNTTSSEKNASHSGPFSFKVGPSGHVELTEQDIFRLLGSLILVSKQTQFDDFEIEGILGIGAFGVVYLAQHKKNIAQGKIQKWAIKRIPKQLLTKKNLISSVKDQRDILAMCNRFLVSLIMAFQDPWYLYLVMECATGGDTYGLIKPGSFKLNSFKDTGEDGVRFIAACVIEALECLHQHDYIYRDLKPQNVLLFEDGYCKLTDFGLVKKSFKGMKSQTISGTELYYAPEMLLTKGYNREIDFWSLGVYLYELSNYEPPFTQEQITKAKFQQACLAAQKNRVWLNPNLSEQLKDLIHSLLKFNPTDRIGVNGGWQQVKQHPFFKSFDWQSLIQGTMPSPLKKIVQMFPISIKPYTKEPPKQVEVQQQKIQGWSMSKKNTI